MLNGKDSTQNFSGLAGRYTTGRPALTKGD